jgi:uncharacterized protein
VCCRASLSSNQVGCGFEDRILRAELTQRARVHRLDDAAFGRHQSDGQMEGDVTVRTCWDADRLDLGRVGIRPDPHYLCTEAARDAEVLAWAYRRSVGVS